MTIKDIALPAADALPETLPGIDSKVGLTHLNNNPHFYREMLLRFLDTKRYAGVEIREKLAAGDRESAARLAHSLKSVAASIGARELKLAAEALEMLLEWGEEEIMALLTEFDTQHSIVINGLQAAFSDQSFPAATANLDKTAFDAALVSKLAEKIMSLLENDMVQALEFVEKIGEQLRGSVQDVRFRKLKSSMDRFDIDEARKVLEEILSESKRL